MATTVKEFEATAIEAEIEQQRQRLAQSPELSIETIPIHLTLGKLYERLGDKTLAIQEYGIAALAYADQGQIIRAMAAAHLIVRLEPENDEILDRLQELYFLRGAVSSDQLDEYQESIKKIESLENDQAEPEDSAEITEGGPESSTPEDSGIDILAVLRQLSFFAKVSVSELKGLSSHSKCYKLAEGESLLTHGNVRRSLFVILDGSLNIFGKDKSQQQILLVTMSAGSSFGEFALFGRIDPNISVVAEQPAQVLEIPRNILLKLAKVRPQISEALKDLYRRRILDSAIARVPLFSQLEYSDREKIIDHFKPVRAKAGVRIVRESTPGDSMFFITSGKVEVYTSLDDGETEAEQLLLATLKSGDFFGEQALVTDEPRSATVKALTDVMMLRFTKKDLDAVTAEYPLIESALEIQAFQNRMRQKVSILKQITPAGQNP